MVDLREHFDRLLDRADDIVDIGFEQEHRAVVVSRLGKVRDHLAAFLEAFLGLVPGVMHPVGFGVVCACLRDHVGRAEGARIADDFLEIADALVALGFVGMNDVGVARDAADRQIVVAKRVAHCPRLVPGDLPGREIDIPEMHVELHRVEAECTDAAGGLGELIGEIAGEYTCLHHDVNSSR
ncbi:hypothetical protein X746_24615 [Mesorhizobium sp. LNJC380A00]|nr:hypothetical protein X746_24615 [Mesorhizobium sp. LNJC380A00]